MSDKSVGALPQEIIDFLLSPGGHSLLIKGEAGTGKTTMALQLVEALSDRQPEYYLSSRVSDVSLYNQFPWLKERVRNNHLMRVGMAFTRRQTFREGRSKEIVEEEPSVDRRELNRLEGQIEAGELGGEDEGSSGMGPDGSITVELGAILPEIELAYDIVEANLPKKTVVVLDSVEALAEGYGIPEYRIVNALQKDLVEKAEANVIYVMETAERNSLDYLGDGVVILRNFERGDHRVRTIELQKMRGSPIMNWKYLFTLDGGRVTVMPRDLVLDHMKILPSQEELTKGRGSFGWSELDRIFGGAALGSLTLFEVGPGVPMDLLRRMEEALVSEHLRQKRGVLWFPQQTLDYSELPAQLSLSDGMSDCLHVLDPRSGEEASYPFVKKLEGEDLSNDLRWESIKYLLKDCSTPYVSLVGLDGLSSFYGPSIVPKLVHHIDTMRRGGHMVMVEAMTGSQGIDVLSHQARLHVRLETLNGSVLISGTKPMTICYCLSLNGDSPRLVPML